VAWYALKNLGRQRSGIYFLWTGCMV